MVMLLLCPQGSQSLASVSTLAGSHVGLGWDMGTFSEMDTGMSAGAGTSKDGKVVTYMSQWPVPCIAAHPARPEGLMAPIPGCHTNSWQSSAALQRMQDMSSHNHGRLEGALKIVPSSP